MSDFRVARRVGSHEIIAICAAAQESLARDVIDTLARIDAQDPLRAGMRIRFGWSMLTLRADGPSALVVCEPDFDEDPLRDVRPRIETTLDVLAAQTLLARRVGVAPADVSFDQSLIVRRDALMRHDVQMFRAPASDDDDSGWRMVSVDLPDSDRADDFETMRVHGLLRTRSAAMAALSLPEEFAVDIHGDTIVAVLDPQGRNALPP